MGRTGMDGSGIEPAGMSSSEALEAVRLPRIYDMFLYLF
jgi:hypothetical protein